jgi:hypothetical protein
VSLHWLNTDGSHRRRFGRAGHKGTSAGTTTPGLKLIEWTAATAEQSSVVEFSFRIRGNLLRRLSGVTIRHNSGARQWTAALRSWTGKTPDPFKTRPIVATGASFPRFRHTRATFSSDRPNVSRLTRGLSLLRGLHFESCVNYGRVKLQIVSKLSKRPDG